MDKDFWIRMLWFFVLFGGLGVLAGFGARELQHDPNYQPNFQRRAEERLGQIDKRVEQIEQKLNLLLEKSND